MKNVGSTPGFPSQMFIINSVAVVQIDCCTHILEETLYFLHVTVQKGKRKMSMLLLYSCGFAKQIWPADTFI